MSTTLIVSDEIAQHLNHLVLGQTDDANEKLRLLLEAEYRRRLTYYRLTDQRLREKYQMAFEEFERQQITKQQDYSWDVESDAMAWETAIDGIRTMQRKLSELVGQVNEHN
jgi:hypothetical protein